VSRFQRDSLLCVCLLLAGCAVQPPQPAQTEPALYRSHLQQIRQIDTFELKGRIGVLTEKKGFSGLLRWYHNPEADEISFFSPLGSQIGQISANRDGVTLTTGDKKTYTADDAETLTRDTLGWSLPLNGLPDWALGRPGTGEARIMAWDSAGRILRMQQAGWDIEYLAYQDGQTGGLPAKVTLKSRELDLKLIIEQWRTTTD
jgi:outer membrane lipoprotein LolB